MLDPRLALRRLPILRALAVLLAIAVVVTAILVRGVLVTRYERDVSRMVFNDNLDLLSDLRRRAGLEGDSLRRLLASRPEPTRTQPYLVVSIEDHRLWYRRADSILFTAEITTGSGKVLEATGSDTHWKFETPRGRLVVVSKETDPVWVAPDWYYVEQAQGRGLGIARLLRGQRLPAEGGVLTVVGSDVVLLKEGRTTQLPVGEGAEIVANGNLVVPPYGTNQRKFKGVLGTHRLNLGDGYAIHGTNRPDLIGRSVSHGCVRVRNEDIATLYELVEPGTAVFIY